MLSYLVNRPSAITYSGALLCDLCSAHDNDSCPVASLQCQGCTLSPTATPNGSRDHSNTPKDSVHNTATTAEHCFGNSRDDAVASDDVDGAVVTTPTSPYQPRVIQPTDAFAISSAFDKYGSDLFRAMEDVSSDSECDEDEHPSMPNTIAPLQLPEARQCGNPECPSSGEVEGYVQFSNNEIKPACGVCLAACVEAMTAPTSDDDGVEGDDEEEGAWTEIRGRRTRS